MRLICTITFVLIVGAVRLQAQPSTSTQLELLQLIPEMDGSARCGLFIVKIESENLSPTGPTIWLEAATKIGRKTVVVRPTQIRPVIEGVMTPTIEVHRAKGGVLEYSDKSFLSLQSKDINYVVLRLNQADYHTSRECLPPPE